MRKLRVGEKVQFRSDLLPFRRYGIYLTRGMEKMVAKKATIYRIFEISSITLFEIYEDDISYSYTPEMLMDLSFKYGK